MAQIDKESLDYLFHRMKEDLDEIEEIDAYREDLKYCIKQLKIILEKKNKNENT